MDDFPAHDSGQEAHEYVNTAELHFSRISNGRITCLLAVLDHCLYKRRQEEIDCRHFIYMQTGFALQFISQL